jgi:hypothetical protein
MSDKAKEAATVHKTNADGKVHVKGYNAIDPQGHLVLVQSLPDGDGWRFATAEDVKKAEDAEKARKSPPAKAPAAQPEKK